MSQYARNNPDEPIRHEWLKGAIRSSGLIMFGDVGEFTNCKGEVCQCRVIGTEAGMLVIDYVKPGTNEKIQGAYIGADDFRPDK